MYKLLGISSIFALALSSCRTTGVDENILMNNAQTDGVIYSSNDERTALNHKERVEDLTAFKKRLTDYTKTNRDDLNALGTLAQVNVALGDLNTAEDLCRTMLRKDLRSNLARKILGQIALRRGQHDLALIHLSNIGGVNAKDASVINMIAQIELFKGHNSTAMSLFKKAIRLDPNDNASRMNLGVLYIKHRQMSLASIEFERVLKAEPRNLDAKIHLAIVTLGRGEVEPAKALLEDVLELDKDNPLALYNLAVAAKQEKDFDGAIDYLKQYIASKRGKAADNNQAFALINRIQRAQSADGSAVSDDEIQEMANDVRKDQKPQQNKSSELKKPNKMAQKSGNTAKARNSKKSEPIQDYEAEEISELEQALK